MPSFYQHPHRLATEPFSAPHGRHQGMHDQKSQRFSPSQSKVEVIRTEDKYELRLTALKSILGWLLMISTLPQKYQKEDAMLIRSFWRRREALEFSSIHTYSRS